MVEFSASGNFSPTTELRGVGGAKWGGRSPPWIGEGEGAKPPTDLAKKEEKGRKRTEGVIPNGGGSQLFHASCGERETLILKATVKKN